MCNETFFCRRAAGLYFALRFIENHSFYRRAIRFRNFFTPSFLILLYTKQDFRFVQFFNLTIPFQNIPLLNEFRQTVLCKGENCRLPLCPTMLNGRYNIYHSRFYRCQSQKVHHHCFRIDIQHKFVDDKDHILCQVTFVYGSSRSSKFCTAACGLLFCENKLFFQFVFASVIIIHGGNVCSCDRFVTVFVFSGFIDKIL